MQILNKKVDLSKVTSKCGSKDNIKHKPGEQGDVALTRGVTRVVLDDLSLNMLNFSTPAQVCPYLHVYDHVTDDSCVLQAAAT